MCGYRLVEGVLEPLAWCNVCTRLCSTCVQACKVEKFAHGPSRVAASQLLDIAL